MRSAIASQITSVSIVYLTGCPDADQSKHQISASLIFVGEIHRWPVNSDNGYCFLYVLMYVAVVNEEET